MSIRNNFTTILKNSANKADEARKLILAILLSGDYTPDGKRKAAASIQSDLAAYLDRQREAVNNAVQHKINDMQAWEEIEQRHRDEDSSYQSLLTDTITLIPCICEANNVKFLKKKVEPFKDDPIAVSALTSVIKKCADEKHTLSEKMAILSVIPPDNSGKRESQLKKLEATMLRHLNNLSVSVADPAYTSLSERTIYQSVRGGASLGVDATIHYMESCDDDDCTVYDQAHNYDGKAEPITFDFGFKHIN